MALFHLIYSYLTNFTKGFFELIGAIETEVLTPWATRLGCDTDVLLIVACLLAALVGLTAYKLIKLYVPLFSAFFGYYVGKALFGELTYEWLPDWSVYVFGGVLALAFLLLTYRRATYVWFVAVAAIGYCVVRFYLVDNFWVALGGAALLALLSVCALRVFFVLITGTVGATLCTAFLFSLLPEVILFERSLFAVERGNFLFWTVLALLAVLFVSIQFVITRRKRKTLSKATAT